MNTGLANEAELYFAQGGPAYRLTRRLAQHGGISHSIGVRILGFLVLTWVPLLCFAVIEGRALGASPRESLLLDFATYARFFLAIPLLIVAEPVVGPRLAGAGLHFVRGGFVRPEDYPAVEEAIARVARWRESFWAELVILTIAVTGAWTLTADVYQAGLATWRSPASVTDNGLGLSLTALWYRLVALPILQFFLYRWLWRLIVWGRFLWTISRLDLRLVATHADQAGGLGFLGTAHLSMGIFAFAASAVLGSEVAFLLVFGNVDIKTFQAPYFAFLALVELIVLGPLLIFLPILLRSRLAWLRDYSLLVVRYNRAFHDKWVAGNPPADEPLLGSADIQSLADLGASFEYIRAMKVVPFSARVMLQLAVVTSIPCLPLLLLVMPISEVISLLTGALI
jgi:hypothetical protein